MPRLEWLYNAAWGLGVRVAHLAKRIGLSGPFERALERIGLRFIPVPKQETAILLAGGIKLVVPPGFPRARTYAHGGYEREVTAVVRRLLRQGMRVVDVGAFCGYYAVLVSRLVGDSGRVYAFEPHPTNYGYLVRNIEANNCHNVLAINKAVADRSENGHLALHEEADHHWLVSSKPNRTALSVRTITLDEYFADEGWPTVDLVKIDVEGGEYFVLQGMRRLSEGSPRLQVIMEYDTENLHRAGIAWEAVAVSLRELGFRRGYVVEQGMKPFPITSAFPALHATYNLLLTKE